MKINRFIVITLIVACLFVSCREDELGESIFDTEVPELNEDFFTYNLDYFLVENFRKPYNMHYIYKMSDVGSNMTYNVIPATFINSKKLAVLIKYLWYDAFLDVVDSAFLKENSPRIIHLIGSAQYNPSSGTEVLGFAEGGVKVTLTKVNDLNENDQENLEQYFHTMHHEFVHILCQNKTFPKEFNLISSEHYIIEWQTRTRIDAACLGFISPYAGSSVAEDIAETVSCYITWPKWFYDQVVDDWATWGVGPTWDGEDGKAIILEKLEIARKWYKDVWNIDIDELREAVHNRNNSVDSDFVTDLLIEYGLE